MSTQSTNGRLFTLNGIYIYKKVHSCFLLLQLLDVQQSDSITTQVCRSVGYYSNPINILMPTFVTTDSVFCVYGIVSLSLSSRQKKVVS